MVHGFTIGEVAKLAGVSERTVRRDIASGRLAVTKCNRRVLRIAHGAARRYRSANPAVITVEQAARDLSVSPKTLRRWIAQGWFQARKSPTGRWEIDPLEPERALRPHHPRW